MPKLSRKSWRQSLSQTKVVPPKPKSTQIADQTSSGKPSRGHHLGSDGSRAAGKKTVELPMGSGNFLILPERFLGCLLVSFALYWHAAFTANEWVYLLSSGFLAAGLISLILPFLQITQIVVEGALQPEVMVSESSDILIRLTRKRQSGLLSLLPINSIRLTVALLRLSAIRQTTEKITPPEVLRIDNFTSELMLSYSTPSLSRGIYELESVQLSSGFPFGLAWWRRGTDLSKDKRGDRLRLTVYPKSLPLSGRFLFKLQGLTARVGLLISTSSILNKSTIVRGVRDYRSGDSLRHIHWPSSAHLGKLLVREFDSEMLPAFSLFLDLAANWRTDEQFEMAVLLIQSLMHLGHKLGTMPELMLNPPLHSKSLAGLVADLPQIPPGLELTREILVRVEPLTTAKIESDVANLKSLVLQSLNDRPLLNVFPVSESLMKYSPQRGDHFVYPIELQLVRGINESKPEVRIKPSGKGKAQLVELGSEKIEAAYWTLRTVHLATIADEADLEDL